MALFDLFRRWNYFKGRDTSDLVEEDLDFAKWAKVHNEWRGRLADYISGNSSETLDEHVVCLDDRCDLGRWIYDRGRHHYGDLPEFNTLRYHHSDFHRSAGQVVSVYTARGAKEAQKVLQEDFDLASLRVVHGLEELEKHVKA